MQEKVSYFGLTIDKNGLQKNMDRCKSVMDGPVPMNVTQV